MPLELTAALVVFLGLIVWRAAHRQRSKEVGPLPDVGEAPPSADPVLVWRYNDDGFTRYLAEVPAPEAERRESDEPIT
jgi:hypothetical protein